MTSAVAAIPPTLSLSVTEVRDLSFDITPELNAGLAQTASSPECTLTTEADGTEVSLGHDATITGNIITQTVSGPADLAESFNAAKAQPVRYLLVVNFSVTPTTSGVTNIMAVELVLIVGP